MDETKKTLDEIFGDEEMYDVCDDGNVVIVDDDDDDLASFQFDGGCVKQEQLDVMNQEIWGLEDKAVQVHQQDNLFDLNEFYTTDFPPHLPLHFPCMSSSSSTSSTPPPLLAKAISVSSTSSNSTSSSDAYWAVWKSDSEDKTQINQYHFNDNTTTTITCAATAAAAAASLSSTDPIPPPGGGDIDCLNVMEDFGYLDLVDDNELWDPSSIFEESGGGEENIINVEEEDSLNKYPQHCEEEELKDGLSFLQGNSELSAMFLDWLKQNRHNISAQDMRSIKFKRSTVESASKRLGNTKEGQKKLLKLILQWVELNHLQKKKKGTKLQTQQLGLATSAPSSIQNPNFNYTNPPVPVNRNNCFSNYSPWIQPPPVLSAPPPAVGYVRDPTQIPGSSRIVHGTQNYFPMEYTPMDFQKTWPGQRFMVSSSSAQFNSVLGNGNLGVAAAAASSDALQRNLSTYKAFDDNGERLVKLGPSATKEARKNRMARHKRHVVHPKYHHRHHNHQNESHYQLNAAGEAIPPWAYWPTTSPLESLDGLHPHTPGVEQPQTRVGHRNRQCPPSYQDQGYKVEKNLKFLLQKVLKQSDVSSLGRIVLPKKEAEMNLPELRTNGSITIALEDISTSYVWLMRYRYWPNNRSRMYLLENAGEFVRKNELKEGDFIVLYLDIKSGKYLIRAVKVRPPQEPKIEQCKKPEKKIRNTPQGTNDVKKENASCEQQVKSDQVSSSSSSSK